MQVPALFSFRVMDYGARVQALGPGPGFRDLGFLSLNPKPPTPTPKPKPSIIANAGQSTHKAVA